MNYWIAVVLTLWLSLPRQLFCDSGGRRESKRNKGSRRNTGFREAGEISRES